MNRSGLKCLDLLENPIRHYEDCAKEYIRQNDANKAAKEFEEIKKLNPGYKISSKLMPIAIESQERDLLRLCSFDGNIDVDRFFIKLAVSNLIRDGVNLNVRDNYGRTPMSNAFNSRNKSLVNFLELKGAIPNDDHGKLGDFFSKNFPSLLRDNYSGVMLHLLMGIVGFGVCDLVMRAYNRDARMDLSLTAIMIFGFVGVKMVCDYLCDHVDNNRRNILNVAKRINGQSPGSEVAGANAARFEGKSDRART